MQDFSGNFTTQLSSRVYPADMDNADTTPENSQPLTGRQAALAHIAEKRRKDPNWNPKPDPTYSGPHPTFVGLMSDAEYDRHMAGVAERHQLATNSYLRSKDEEKLEPQPTPRRVVRAALPFGQRIRELRRDLRWSQREVASQLGVSARTIIRYEQGRSAPLQSAPLLALRRLESAVRRA